MNGSLEIGLQLFTTAGHNEGFFRIGWNVAIFSSSGTHPEIRELFTIDCRIEPLVPATSLNSLTGTMSLKQLECFSFCTISQISCSDTDKKKTIPQYLPITWSVLIELDTILV